jgi:hypothetical protein
MVGRRGGPVLRPVIAPWIGAHGVRTRGVTAAGVREWYAIHDLRPITMAQACLDGEDLGLRPPAASHEGCEGSKGRSGLLEKYADLSSARAASVLVLHEPHVLECSPDRARPEL